MIFPVHKFFSFLLLILSHFILKTRIIYVQNKFLWFRFSKNDQNDY